MDNLKLTFGAEVAIYSARTNGFLRYDIESRRVKADGIHPFLKATWRDQEQSICLEEFRIYSEKDLSQKSAISFGSHILIINKNGCYLTVDDEGNLRGTEINSQTKGPNPFLKCTWAILHRDNAAIKKVVQVTDPILFKSSTGHFLRVEEQGMLRADSTNYNEKSVWYMCKSKVPFIPNWARTRPFVSSSHLVPLMNTQLPIKNEPSSKADPRLETVSGQERVLIQELLYAMLSIEGKFIKRIDDGNNRFTYHIDRNSQLDSSLILMAAKILPLCENHDKVQIFISKYSTFDNGLIFQAFANALKSIRRDYVVAVNSMDQEYNKGNYTLQRLWYDSQKPAKVFEYLHKTILDIEANSENILSILYKSLTIATDSDIHHIVYYLLQQGVYPFLEMLGKWIYYGIVDDKFDEFMIAEVRPSQRLDNATGIDKFVLKTSRVPYFLMSMKDRILETGSYLNVIKNYDKSSHSPHSHDLIENHEAYLQRQDFTECIEKAYSWANKELIRIVLQEKQLVQRLQSIKQYFFLESGDLFMHFIQTAKGELIRDPRLVSQEKLQSLLELSIRTSNSEKDPFKDDVTCYLSTEHWETVMPVFHAYFAQKSSESMTQLEAVLQKEIGLQFSLPGSGKADPALRIYCFDYFTLDYNVEWPLNLILSDSNMMVYKVVFRHLFNMRIAERELYSFWKQLQSQRSQNMNGGYRVEFVLVQRMINFLKTVQYNFFYEVIEEHWRTLMTNLKKVTIFSDAVACHKEFIENIARDTLVADPDFSKILKKILVVCMFPTRINLNHPPVSKKFEAGPKGRLGNQMDEERRQEAGDSRKDPFKLQGLSNKFDSLVTTLLNYMEKQQHRFERTFTNLHQRLDMYGYYQYKK